MKRGSLFLVIAIATAAACDKNSDPSGPPPEPITAAPSGGPSSGGMGAAPRNPHEGVDPHAGIGAANSHGGGDPHAGMAMPNPHGGGEAASDPSQSLVGVIKVDAKLAAQVNAGDTIFLAARKIDPETNQPLGAPVAVGILQAGAFPMEFRLDAGSAMMQGTKFDGEVMIKARVDHDGEAKTTEPGDIEGAIRAKIPATGLELVLDTPIK